jgi:nascent polypeptide-associated complex subunit alpha
MLNIDPKKMQAMMKQLGMKSENIDASRVIIECEDKNIVIETPSVTKVVMHGQEQFQIAGDVREEEKGISEEDIKIIQDKTNADREKILKTLKDNNGDIAQTIIDLS